MIIKVFRLVDAFCCATCGARVGVWQTGWQDGEDGPAYCDEHCAALDRMPGSRGNGTLFAGDLTAALDREAVQLHREREES